VALCYVLCGPRHETPEGSIEHFLYRRKDGGVKLEYFLDAGVLDVGEEMSIGKKSFCPQARVLIEPYTITEPGSYLLVAYRSDVDKSELLETVAKTPTAWLTSAEEILAAVPFSMSN